ncbi:phospho-N-acetylmuramoyl-pentapeptide-transferase [Streptococcus cuniculipharyngis]|uniref:Phospho-N-acetylmuramoyl-pentapeptide-transferase n=1 Tax=Streptococcus cuniculipharyngis TaxID=1562651 RepID=A0A5C5SDZ7_9STRE|nr:phospho-N-acetylmuramoyl-pentapeptide-transferase [Streptococcus cuniculipharyngis]TWS98123.1 phospho-N-acetylmuramoyl-pentapeptide-transferase [Streptococcus cuniculipharyngis]
MFVSLMAGGISFALTVFLIPHFMTFFQRKKIGGQQMHEDVKQHMAKAGTPTMGGFVFLSVSVVVSLLALLLTTLPSQWAPGLAILSVVLIYGGIGFLDDFLKIFKKINEGLTPSQKMSAQILAGLIFYFAYSQPSGATSLNLFGLDLNLGIFYLGFVLFWIVGFSNAVNLTDGLDGLASISVVISLTAYGIIALVQKQYDVLLLIVSTIGGLLGFFLYNKKPAKIFMGDVGSLALGALLATISIALHQEWTLLLIGFVYVCETSSVMLQVAYFKYTKKKYGEGRRIFRMTPLHHHFELGGFTGRGQVWSEWKVDIFFWLVGLLMSALTLLILYL